MAEPWEEYAQQKDEGPWSAYESTGGGAAMGNPNLAAQGRKKQIGPAVGEALQTIGGAGAIGAAMGAAAPEILGGAATVAAGLPPPFSGLRGPLNFMSGAARTAGRGVGAVAGGVSGVASETAGQIAENAGAGPVVAEGARLAAGGLANEPYNLLKTYVTKPALTFASHVKKQIAKSILGKVEGDPQALSDKERAFIDEVTAEIRGGAKSDAPLEAVGGMMGQEASRRALLAGVRTKQASDNAGFTGDIGGYPAVAPTPIAEIGSGLQQAIVKRQDSALKTRAAEYTKTQQQRDAIVAQKEAAGQFPQNSPEYTDIIKSLESEITPGRRSADVAKSFKNILAEIKTRVDAPAALTERQALGYDPKPAPKETPASFQAIDDVRRKLGEVFRGKPPEGYEGIDADTAKRYYGMLSKLQKSYAGEPQAKLLDDYAQATSGLEIFSSKFGKKATALDQYREGQYPDPSAIPAAYFKTKASVKALQELTGDKAMVEAAALDYARHQLQGKNAAQVRTWRMNNEWLSETPSIRSQVDGYAARLEAADKAAMGAKEFASKTSSDVAMLTRKALPAQRAVELMKSGDTELWAKIIPAVNKSPQAKEQMVKAARQVVADMATTKETSTFFTRNLRPFLEQSGAATKTEMDVIADGLRKIQDMAMPEAQKIGWQRRMLLNAIGGEASSLGSRGIVAGAGLIGAGAEVDAINSSQYKSSTLGALTRKQQENRP